VAPPSSAVAEVFDSIFGKGLDAETTGAGLAGSPPASPTHSSGSERGGATGPSTFRRAGGRPR